MPPPAAPTRSLEESTVIYPLEKEPGTGDGSARRHRARGALAAHAAVHRAAVDQCLGNRRAGRLVGSSTRDFIRAHQGSLDCGLRRCPRRRSGGAGDRDPHAPRPLWHGGLDRGTAPHAALDEPLGIFDLLSHRRPTRVVRRRTRAVQFYRSAGWDERAIEKYKAKFGFFGGMIYPMPHSYRRICDGETLRMGAHAWQVVVGNGHSPEHACLYCAELKLLISGDQVLPKISSNVSVFPTEPDANPLDDWMTSLAKIAARVPDDVLVLPAHKSPFRGLHARIGELIESHQRGLRSLERFARGKETRRRCVPGAVLTPDLARAARDGNGRSDRAS